MTLLFTVDPRIEKGLIGNLNPVGEDDQGPSICLHATDERHPVPVPEKPCRVRRDETAVEKGYLWSQNQWGLFVGRMKVETMEGRKDGRKLKKNNFIEKKLTEKKISENQKTRKPENFGTERLRSFEDSLTSRRRRRKKCPRNSSQIFPL